MSTDRLNKGDIVLVTGVTGLLGASVADDLASRGLKVRGVTRDASKAQLLKEKIDKLYGPGLIEFVEVKDAAAPGAYRAALEGVSGVIHLALDVSSSFGEEPNTQAAIDSAVNMTLGILKSATEVPTVKGAVVTSSVAAHYSPEFGKDIKASVNDWNDASVKTAYELPTESPYKGVMTYLASKTRSEQELWEWVEKTKPSFTVNTVLPHMVFGRPFNPAEGTYSTSTWLAQLFNGIAENNPIVAFFSPGFWVVDVRDQAVIHVAALLASDTQNERLWAAGQPPIGINKVLALWRETFPERKFVPDFPLGEPPKQELERDNATALLKRYAGRDWIPVEETLLDNVRYLA